QAGGPDRCPPRPRLTLQAIADLERLPRARGLERLVSLAALAPRVGADEQLACRIERPQLGEVPVEGATQDLEQRDDAVLDVDRLGEQVHDGVLGRLVLLRAMAL